MRITNSEELGAVTRAIKKAGINYDNIQFVVKMTSKEIRTFTHGKILNDKYFTFDADNGVSLIIENTDNHE
jgi:hypothetical protein